MMKLQAQTVPQIKPLPVRETELEPMYWVIIHNDDVTPMDFVVHILHNIFQIDGLAAVHIMFTAHYNGEAYVQCLPKAEAQNRVNRAHFAAGIEGYPLHFSLEPENKP
jgi:ATP-dependent Clp protease adaptor protein ClpS